MYAAADKNLKLISQELAFIRRHVHTIECSRGEYFETVDRIALAVQSALEALDEYKLSLEPEVTEEAAGVALAA